MAYLIGVDEAGYGPNLGPLAIGTTVWHINAADPIDLYERLSKCVTNDVTSRDPQRLIIADSKLIYSTSRGLANLEQQLLTALSSIGVKPSSWAELYQALIDPSCEKLESTACSDHGEVSIPTEADSAVNESLATHFHDECQRTKCELIEVRAALVFPKRFNSLLETHGNKSTVLSHLTLELVASAMSQIKVQEPLFIFCDKHGGRNRYSALLQSIFPEYLVEIHREAEDESIYRWGPKTNRTEIHFTAKGERFLPSALASMTAKYLRELSMLAFNSFWRRHLPHLKPTAGYPVDAKRFRKEISGKQSELSISDFDLWRNR